MSLETKLIEDMKLAMKAKDQLKLSVIRYTRSAIQRFQVDNRNKELTDKEIENILLSEAKKRKDSIASFKEAGRDDLVEKEEKELQILLQYLPRQLSCDELREIIKKRLLELEANGKKDFARIMKVLVPELRNQADGNLIKELVSEELGK